MTAVSPPWTAAMADTAATVVGVPARPAAPPGWSAGSRWVVGARWGTVVGTAAVTRSAGEPATATASATPRRPPGTPRRGPASTVRARVPGGRHGRTTVARGRHPCVPLRWRWHGRSGIGDRLAGGRRHRRSRAPRPRTGPVTAATGDADGSTPWASVSKLPVALAVLVAGEEGTSTSTIPPGRPGARCATSWRTPRASGLTRARPSRRRGGAGSTPMPDSRYWPTTWRPARAWRTPSTWPPGSSSHSAWTPPRSPPACVAGGGHRRLSRRPPRPVRRIARPALVAPATSAAAPAAVPGPGRRAAGVRPLRPV